MRTTFQRNGITDKQHLAAANRPATEENSTRRINEKTTRDDKQDDIRDARQDAKNETRNETIQRDARRDADTARSEAQENERSRGYEDATTEQRTSTN